MSLVGRSSPIHRGEDVTGVEYTPIAGKHRNAAPEDRRPVGTGIKVALPWSFFRYGAALLEWNHQRHSLRSIRASFEENKTLMKAMLYLQNKEDPAAILDEVTVLTLNDNHKADPVRISYKSQKLNAGKTMIELLRHEKMLVKLEDGRYGSVVLQHSSLDMEGNAVGVLRVVGDLQE